jgi:hypothetical protein
MFGVPPIRHSTLQASDSPSHSSTLPEQPKTEFYAPTERKGALGTLRVLSARECSPTRPQFNTQPEHSWRGLSSGLRHFLSRLKTADYHPCISVDNGCARKRPSVNSRPSGEARQIAYVRFRGRQSSIATAVAASNPTTHVGVSSRQDQQKRFQGCGGNRRGGDTSERAFRSY